MTAIEAPRLLHSLARAADKTCMNAYITVSDASGRLLCRRLATDAEIMSALRAAEVAESEAQSAMERIAADRAQAIIADLAHAS